MQYQEYDLKTEQTIISQEDQTITTIPSSKDTLAVQLERAERCGGHAMTTCRATCQKDDIKGAERQMSVPKRPVAGRLP